MRELRSDSDRQERISKEPLTSTQEAIRKLRLLQHKEDVEDKHLSAAGKQAALSDNLLTQRAKTDAMSMRAA